MVASCFNAAGCPFANKSQTYVGCMTSNGVASASLLGEGERGLPNLSLVIPRHAARGRELLERVSCEYCVYLGVMMNFPP